MRGPDGLLWITWAGGGFSLVEVVVVGAIILLGDWPRYAREAKARQEAGRAETATSADGDEPQEPEAQEPA